MKTITLQAVAAEVEAAQRWAESNGSSLETEFQRWIADLAARGRAAGQVPEASAGRLAHAREAIMQMHGRLTIERLPPRDERNAR